MGKAIFTDPHGWVPMHTDLTRSLESVTTTLSADADKAGVRLRVDVAKGLQASAEGDLLEHALYLTLLGSLRESPQGSEVWVTADRETDDCTVRLSGSVSPAWSGSRRLLEEAVAGSGGDVRAHSCGVVVRLARC